MENELLTQQKVPEGRFTKVFRGLYCSEPRIILNRTMPHITLEYSQNLIAQVNVPQLLTDLHHALAAQPDIDLKKIKTKALVIVNSVVKDKPFNEGYFLHVTVSVLEGRSEELRRQYGEALFAVLTKAVPDMYPDCAVTLEVREMERATYFQKQ